MTTWSRGVVSRTGRGVLSLESIVVGAAVDLADTRCIFRMVALGTMGDWLALRDTTLGLGGWRIFASIAIAGVGLGMLRVAWSCVLRGPQERLRIDRRLTQGVDRVRIVDPARDLWRDLMRGGCFASNLGVGIAGGLALR